MASALICTCSHLDVALGSGMGAGKLGVEIGSEVLEVREVGRGGRVEGSCEVVGGGACWRWWRWWVEVVDGAFLELVFSLSLACV